MARKSVKTISINGITGAVYSATVIDGRTTTNGEIAAYGDTLFTTAASPVLHASELTVDIIDEGGQYAALKSLVGTNASVSITASYGDGSAAPTAGEGGVSGTCAILSVTGDSVAVDSDGRSLIHVTICKQASAS